MGASSDRLDIFVASADGNVYHQYWSNGWGAWESWGGTGQASPRTIASAPAVVSSFRGRIDVFAASRDARSFHKACISGWFTSGSQTGNWEILTQPDI